MTSDALLLADGLVRKGRYAEAGAILKLLGPPRFPEAQVIASEVWYRVGRCRDAERLARSLLRDADLRPDLRTRCLTVLGSLEFDSGRHFEAVRTLEAAVAVAKHEGCLSYLCWAELRLLMSLFELSPSSVSPALLSDLRRHVTQAGDISVTAALHISMSEIEAKRGAVFSAQRHVTVAKGLLERHDNCWLMTNCRIAQSCASYLISDLEASQRAALEAIQINSQCGNIHADIAANLNLGHIALAKGVLSLAERHIKEAFRLSAQNARAAEAALEALAQIELARGNYADCAKIVESLLSRPSAAYTHPKLWAHATLVRCLGLSGDWHGALSAASRGIALAEAVRDPSLVVLLAMLSAECQVKLGDVAAAAVNIDRALTILPRPPLELLAEAQRVLGRTMVGDDLGGAAASRRARRIFNCIGQSRACADVDEYIRQNWRRSVPSSQSGALECDDLHERPDLLLQSVAAIIQQAPHPELLAAEIAELLLAARLCRRIAVFASVGSQQQNVRYCVNWTTEDAFAAVSQPNAALVSLGTSQGTEWRLLADVPSSVTARSTWQALCTLTTSAIELAAARREAREREALWPVENLDEAAQGVFGSDQMKELVRVAKRIAATPVTVLITGETGTGKEVVGRLLHDASPRSGKPFIPLNCSAVPRDMLEDQLFGHRRGAFTGAESAFTGVIRAAAGGTVFLDEIGEIGLDLQPKLLRFLESNEVHPLGEPHPVKVDVRILAATNQDLEQLVREGRFREDLYYRLNVIRLHVPPLRERREEIPLLVSHFLERVARELHKGRLRIADETMEYLVLYKWPGNVRQLANEIRRLVALAETDAVLMPEHLSPDLVASRLTKPASERELLRTEVVVRLDQPLAAATEHLERAMIQHAWTRCNGRVEQVARTLGLSRKGLYLKRQRLRLEPAAV